MGFYERCGLVGEGCRTDIETPNPAREFGD